MQTMTPFVALALLAFGAPAVAENPLGRVLRLMDTLAAKVQKDGEAEAKAYKEFVAWCDAGAQNTRFAIKTAESKKAKLEAVIGKEAGDVEASVAKISALVASLSTAEEDLSSATEIRKKESKDFVAKESELVDVVSTLGRAITVLERQMAKSPAAFAQLSAAPGMDGIVKSLSVVVDAASFSSADKRRLLAMVQAQQGASADDEEIGAPDSAAYKTHSGSILDVLEDLKEKAEEQLSGLRKAEVSAKHNFALLKQSMDDQITVDSKDLSDEKASKAASQEAKATAEGDLVATVKDLENGRSVLQATTTSCMTTAADHEATVAARKEELEVIAKAKKILKDSSSGAVEQTYSLLQQAGESQLRTRTDLAGAEVVTLVRRLADKHHSAALAQLASRIAAVLRFGAVGGADPFSKVKSLVADLISKLEQEAQSEASEKSYCDEQIAKTAAKKDDLDSETSKLTSKIDKASATSAGLKEDVKEFQEQLSALAKEQAEMDRMRQEEHANYAQAKADLDAGLAGVRQALGVLREYYGSGGASMIQDGMMSAMQQPAMPEKHTKAGDAGSSIIGILEVVESDFAKNLVAASTEEDDAEAAYDKKTQENKVTRTLKEQDVKYNSREFQSLDKEIADLSADRETTGAELSAVLEYDEKIKARCIAKPETYESRKARREAEIQGLKEALNILQDETALTQRNKRSFRGHFLSVHKP